MPNTTEEQDRSPLEELANEPSLDELFGTQPDLPDNALLYFVRQQRVAMREYHRRVEEKRK